MPLKIKYLIYTIVLHVLLLVGDYWLLTQTKQSLYFILIEIGIVASFILSISFLSDFLKPTQLLESSKNAFEDEDFTVKFVEKGNSEVNDLIQLYNNMVDRIRLERTEIEEQHFFLQKLIDASPNGIILLDYDYRITNINPSARQLLDLKKDYFNTDLQHIPHPLLQQISKIKIGESKVIRLQGSQQFKCTVSGFIHRGFQRNFVVIQELSKELLKAEKEAYGKVIRMMAHEVNNSIGAINSILLSIAAFEELEGKEFGEDIRLSLKVAVERNTHLNNFMKNFAKVIRLPKAQKQQINLNGFLKQIALLFKSQLQSLNINLELVLPAKVVQDWMDPYQMEQALLNILKNAIESIERNGQIRMELSKGPTTILIFDNGRGIAEDIADKLFSPFFSTKETGQGVGLTLVKEILTAHQMQFSLQTLENGWTVFKIVFPA